MADDRTPGGAQDLFQPQGAGPLWGTASSDLNATLLVWPAGHEVAQHTNTELDVLLLVLEGRGAALIDEQEHPLSPGNALLIRKGSSRAIRAGATGIRYVSVHSRTGPLQIKGLPPAAEADADAGGAQSGFSPETPGNSQ